MLRVRPDDLAPRALVVGDPGRAAEAAGLLDDCARVGANREYVTYTGRRDGQAVSIVAHGVGAAGAGVCFEELARGGVKTLVRAGSCGAIDPSLADGELVIATSAVRDEGLTPRLVPATYPAVADAEVAAALVTAARSRHTAPRQGIVLTSNLFYPGPLGPVDWALWRRSRVLAIEMELSALFVIASLHGLRAGGILVVDGNPSIGAQDMSDYDPHRGSVHEGTTRMLEIALDALRALASR